MIDASWELAQRLGEHPVKPGCTCISCVNKRKRILKEQQRGLIKGVKSAFAP